MTKLMDHLVKKCKTKSFLSRYKFGFHMKEINMLDVGLDRSAAKINEDLLLMYDPSR